MSVPVWNKNEWIKNNEINTLPISNDNGELIVIGCNYHTTWQSHKQMRFVLVHINGNHAVLKTRNTRKCFTTSINDLIFIKSKYNKSKAIELRPSIKSTIKQLL